MGDIDVIIAFLRKEPYKKNNVVSTGNKLFIENTCLGQWLEHGVLINRTDYDGKYFKTQENLFKQAANGMLIFRALTNVPLESENLKEYYNECE